MCESGEGCRSSSPSKPFCFFFRPRSKGFKNPPNIFSFLRNVLNSGPADFGTSGTSSAGSSSSLGKYRFAIRVFPIGAVGGSSYSTETLLGFAFAFVFVLGSRDEWYFG